uniref:Uncharacterized protein n=1 Tax=Oryza punctata TaxID=4537 RepID=A0A0E0LE65_ORYPU
MDAIDSVVDPLREFAKDSVRLVKRCHKPDRKGREPSSSPRLLSSLPMARFPQDLTVLWCCSSEENRL